MESSQIEAKVKQVIQQQLNVEEERIKPDSSFIDDLGADSLGLIELVLALEESFNIDISDEETASIKTVQDATHYIQQHSAIQV